MILAIDTTHECGSLALLAGGLVITALAGGRAVRMGVLVICAVAAAFTLHALAAPATSGANIFDPALLAPGYAQNTPRAGPGETVALIGLGAAILGLVMSLTAD